MRVLAKDLSTGVKVKVSLRDDFNDLTIEDLNLPAYFHENRKTISGRLRVKSGNYIFVRN